MGIAASVEAEAGGDAAGDVIGDLAAKTIENTVRENILSTIIKDEAAEDAGEMAEDSLPEIEEVDDGVLDQEALDREIDEQVNAAGGGVLCPAARRALGIAIKVSLGLSLLVGIGKAVVTFIDKKDLAKEEGAEVTNLVKTMVAGYNDGKADVAIWNNALTTASRAGKLSKTVEIPGEGKVAINLAFNPSFEDAVSTFLTNANKAIANFYIAIKASGKAKKAFPIAAAKVAQTAFVTQAQKLITSLQTIQANSENQPVLEATGINFNQQIPGLESNLTAVQSITFASS